MKTEETVWQRRQTPTTKLEARIVELENALKALLREPVDLTADEIRTYLKVRDALACDITAVADYPCSNAVATRQRHICSSCIPMRSCVVLRPSGLRCDIGYFGGGGLERFTDLGS